MNELLEKFLALLEGETCLYESLLSVLQKEKRAVVNSALNDLNETVKEKENLALKIRILEEERIRTTEKLANSLGYPSHPLTLTDLSELVEEPYATRLGESRSILLSLTQSIQEINQSNRGLLSHSLELVKGSISLLNNLMHSNPVYYRSGQVQMGDQSGKILSGRV